MSPFSSSSQFSTIWIINILYVVLVLPQALQAVGLSSKSMDGSGGRNRYPQRKSELPKLIGHRGDKALLPEHTVPGYNQAMLTDVDFVEPDLMMTKDKVLVCHHDITLRASTDVSTIPVFAMLMTKNVTLFLDGSNVTILNDWLIPNFTLAQLKRLKINQANVGVRPHYFDGFFSIPTFQEYIDAVHKDTWRRGIFKPKETFVMGMIPELKYPDIFNTIFDTPHLMETTFLEQLKLNGYMYTEGLPSCKYDQTVIPCSPLVVQCYNVETIKYLSATTNLKLMTLLDTQNLRYLTYQGMAELANETTYVAIWKEHLFTGTQAEVDSNNVVYDPAEIKELGGFIEPQKIVDYAHGLGMKVGIYTIYSSYEKSWRGCSIQCVNDTKEMELHYYFDLGVDAFFVEGLSESLRIRDKYFRGGEGGGGGGGGSLALSGGDGGSNKV